MDKKDTIDFQKGLVKMIGEEFLMNKEFYTKAFSKRDIPPKKHKEALNVIAAFLYSILYYIDTGTNFLDPNVCEGAKIFYDSTIKEK